MIERNPTVDLEHNKVVAEVELEYDAGYQLRVTHLSTALGERQINSDCNTYGAMVSIARAIERAGEAAQDGDTIHFTVEFTKK